MRWLPIACLFLIGCNGPAPVSTETDGQGAARVFALAQDLENGRKMKQAMAAYHQIVRQFPDIPEAKKSAQRIAQAQCAAVRKVATRKAK